MTQLTPGWAIPYPDLTDEPNGAAQMNAMATRIDTLFSGADSRLTALEGNPGSRFMGSSAPGNNDVIGNSETILSEKVTFTAVAGRKYLVMHTSDTAIASGSPSAATWNFRYAAGSSISTSGTLIQQYIGPPPTGGHSTDSRHTVFTAPASGTYTIGVGYFTNSSSATVTHYANARRLTVTDIT